MSDRKMPNYYIIKGAQFKHSVAIVVDKYPDGTPKTIKLLKDDETIDLEDPALPRATQVDGGFVPQFITMYIPTHVVEKVGA